MSACTSSRQRSICRSHSHPIAIASLAPLASHESLALESRDPVGGQAWNRGLGGALVVAETCRQLSQRSETGIAIVGIISGTTTENCCHATARDVMFRNYRVVFLTDATATYDYPDRGFGPMSNADVHHATLVILAASTAHALSVAELKARLASGHGTKDAPSRVA